MTAHLERMNKLLESELSTVRMDCENAELALRAERRKVSALLAERKADQVVKAAKGKVIEVFEHWQVRCMHPTAKLGPKRVEAIERMLNLRPRGFTVEDLKLAIDGAAKGAFEKDGKRYDDIELICRNEVNVERFMALAKPEEKPLREAAPDIWTELGALLRETQGEPVISIYGNELFTCPACSATLALEMGVESLDCQVCHAGPREVIAALRRAA